MSLYAGAEGNLSRKKDKYGETASCRGSHSVLPVNVTYTGLQWQLAGGQTLRPAGDCVTLYGAPQAASGAAATTCR